LRFSAKTKVVACLLHLIFLRKILARKPATILIRTVGNPYEKTDAAKKIQFHFAFGQKQASNATVGFLKKEIETFITYRPSLFW
jgi:hypothetical protein